MAVSSTNVSVGSGNNSVLGHYGLTDRQSAVSNNRFFQDLAFIPYFSTSSSSPQISFSDFAGVRGAIYHSLGGISLTTSEPRAAGSYQSSSAVQYQAQNPTSSPRGDRIACLLYDTNDNSPGAMAVNSYFITATGGGATLQLDWDVQNQSQGGHAMAIVRSYKYGYINGPWINNGIYEGTSSIGSLSCSMDTAYPHTIISLGIWGPGFSTVGLGAALIYKARLR